VAADIWIGVPPITYANNKASKNMLQPNTIYTKIKNNKQDIILNTGKATQDVYVMEEGQAGIFGTVITMQVFDRTG